MRRCTLCGIDARPQPDRRAAASKGADVNAPDVQCGITLRAASGECHERVVEQLLGEVTDVHAQGGGRGSTALQAASAAGHDPIVEPLLGKEAVVNGRGGDYRSALQAASTAGYDNIVRQVNC